MTDIDIPKSEVGRHTAWCECMLTETLEIETITKWAAGVPQPERPEWDTAACEAFKTSIGEHLDLAKGAAKARCVLECRCPAAIASYSAPSAVGRSMSGS